MACVPIEASTNRWLSTAACATRSEPTNPPPPGMFSMMTCWPSVSPSAGCRMRASVSIGPPAANGTTMVTGRTGQSCAPATLPPSASAAAKESTCDSRQRRSGIEIGIMAPLIRLELQLADEFLPARHLRYHPLAQHAGAGQLQLDAGGGGALDHQRVVLHRGELALEPLHDRGRQTVRTEQP